MTIVLDGTNLTIENLVLIARGGEEVSLAPQSLERINICRTMLEEKIQAKDIMYGVNTGIGEFSEVVLSDDQVRQFQRYLIYNHAAGIGDPMPIECVRAAMAGRINVHAHGNSGGRLEITQTLIDMLNKGVTPVVCEKVPSVPPAIYQRCLKSRSCLWGRGKLFIKENAFLVTQPWREQESPSPICMHVMDWPQLMAQMSSQP